MNIFVFDQSTPLMTKQTNKQIKGQSKISRFLIPTKHSGVGGGVKAQTKTKNIYTIMVLSV